MINLYALQTWDVEEKRWFTNSVVDQDYYDGPEGYWMHDPSMVLKGSRIARYTIADVLVVGEEDYDQPVPGEEPPCKSQS